MGLLWSLKHPRGLPGTSALRSMSHSGPNTPTPTFSSPSTPSRERRGEGLEMMRMWTQIPLSSLFSISCPISLFYFFFLLILKCQSISWHSIKCPCGGRGDGRQTPTKGPWALPAGLSCAPADCTTFLPLRRFSYGGMLALSNYTAPHKQMNPFFASTMIL